jgi:hypothetical protein
VRGTRRPRSNAITDEHQVGSNCRTISLCGGSHGVPSRLATLRFCESARSDAALRLFFVAAFFVALLDRVSRRPIPVLAA